MEKPVEMNIKLTPKQDESWAYADDDVTTELGYGGAARGGKSWNFISKIVVMSLAFPDTRHGLARRELKNLKRTSLQTFFKICKEYGLEAGKHFTFKQQDGIIQFYNESEIVLLDTAYSPQDPLYLRFGGLELTTCLIEESNESPLQAIKILKTRVGNWNNDKYNIKPLLMETFNPDKGHVYARYFRPWKENKMPHFRKFIRALPTDNPYVPKSYIENLKNADEVTRQRLLYGNFEYDDDPAKLMEINSIYDLFTNSFIKKGEKYLIADLAMQGRDNFVISYWDGLRGRIVGCKIVDGERKLVWDYYKEKSKGKEIEEDLKFIAEQLKVPRSQVLADSDGLGNYLESYMTGIIEFHGGASAKNKIEFINLRAECYFKLAELINKKEIYFECPIEDTKNQITAELEQIKRDEVDKDDKRKKIIPKKIIKENLGNSPDFADILMMRMFFEVKRSGFTVRAG